MKINHAKKTSITLGSSWLVILLCMAFVLNAFTQDKTNQRGFNPGGSYSISDIETISNTNGDLMIHFPLGQLPAGRGGLSAGISLVYNSKLYDRRTEYDANEEQVCQSPAGCYYQKQLLDVSGEGGWTYTSGYYLTAENRWTELNTLPPSYQPTCTDGDGVKLLTYIYKLFVVFPDGSKHQLIPFGFTDGNLDRYYNVSPDGYINWCNGSQTRTGSPVSYYTIDGTYMRVQFSYDNDNDPNNNTWTLYSADGSRFESAANRMFDQNGNYIQFGSTVSDQFGRSITTTHNYETGEDEITSKGTGGHDLTWRVHWKQIFVKRQYSAYPMDFTCDKFSQNCPPNYDPETFGTWFSVVDRITLPEQSGSLQYQFGYNGSDTLISGETTGFGELSSITMPSGASYSYTYKLDSQYSPTTFIDATEVLKNSVASKTLTYRPEYDLVTGDPISETWVYGFSSGGSGIVGPDGGQTSEAFGNLDLEQPDMGLTYLSIDADGTKREKIWRQNYTTNPNNFFRQTNPYLKTEFTSIKDSTGAYTLTSAKDFDYDKNGNVTETREYDWMPYSSIPRDGYTQRPNGLPTNAGSYLSRVTRATFYNDTPNAASTDYSDPDTYDKSSNKRLLRLTKSSEMLDASYSPKARSEMLYDYTDYDNSNSLAGNITQTKSWDSYKGGSPQNYSNPLTSMNSVTTSVTYNSYGMPLTTTDANGNATWITYGNVQGPNGNVTDLYPTQMIQAHGTSVARTSAAAYDFYTGLVTTLTDVDNGVSTVTTYDDFGRPIKVATAAGSPVEAWTQTEYHDSGRYVVVRSDLETIGDAKKATTQFYDQLGRVRLSKTLEDASYQSATNESDGIKVQTRYMTDFNGGTGVGHSYQLVSNPYRALTSGGASGETTMGWTLSTSRNDGRHSEVQTFSGSSLPSPWGDNSTSTGTVQTDISANATTVTDQASKLRRSITNGLGELIRVDEPNSGNDLGSVATPNQATYYSYNVLGKLVRVQQGVQNRYFMYDSLGRVIRVKQPEQEVNTALNTSGNPDNNSWTAGFSCDGNGNVLSAVNANGTTVTSSYDALNRVMQRSYNDDPATPTVNFSYDGNGVSPTPSFAKGKLTKVENGVSQTLYSNFDAAGRLLSSEQRTPLDGETISTATPRTSSYQYGLSGSVIQEAYPSGRIVNQAYDAKGDIVRIFGKRTSTATEQTYATDFSYTPDEKIEKLKLGNGLFEAAKLNSNLQVTELTLGHAAGDGSLLKLNYDYGELEADGVTVDATKNAGNIAKQTVTFNGVANPFVQAYKYDSLDRIVEAKETVSGNQTWKQTFGYDIYGNRTDFYQMVGLQELTMNNLTLPTIDSSTNRFQGSQGYSYDKNGNVTADPMDNGRSFVFDGENKQIEVKDSSNTTIGRYYYDGNGHRVKKVTNLETTVFVYDGLNKLIAEYSSAAPPSNPTTNYTATDQLGSPRVLTDAYGQVVSRRDFMPFGEELYADGTTRTSGSMYSTTNQDAVRQRFTGYPKDGETGLDFAEARYYNDLHGRFTAIDPLLSSGTATNPQTFNRYTYVGNRPLLQTDSTGLQAATNPTKANISTDPSVIKDWFIRGSGPNSVPNGDTSLDKKSNQTLGLKNTMSGGYINENVDVTFESGADPNEYSSERAVVLQTNLPNASAMSQPSDDTRNGGSENPKDNQVVVNGQTKSILDAPGMGPQMSAEGLSRSGMANATYTAYFVQGERNGKTGKLDSNIFFYKVQIGYDSNGNIKTSKNDTNITRITRQDFINGTKKKDPEVLLEPSKKKKDKNKGENP